MAFHLLEKQGKERLTNVILETDSFQNAKFMISSDHDHSSVCCAELPPIVVPVPPENSSLLILAELVIRHAQVGCLLLQKKLFWNSRNGMPAHETILFLLAGRLLSICKRFIDYFFVFL